MILEWIRDQRNCGSHPDKILGQSKSLPRPVMSLMLPRAVRRVRSEKGYHGGKSGASEHIGVSGYNEVSVTIWKIIL